MQHEPDPVFARRDASQEVVSSERASRVGAPTVPGDSAGGLPGGPPSGGSEEGSDRRESRSDLEEDVHPVKGRPRPRDASQVIVRLNQAFLEGDPDLAYSSSQELIKEYHLLQLETSKLRFQVNFGTPVCETCSGLRAGPGVSATCFQVKQCNYSNVREGGETPSQKRILEGLMK